jgi:hypothetical protein
MKGKGKMIDQIMKSNHLIERRLLMDEKKENETKPNETKRETGNERKEKRRDEFNGMNKTNT